MCIRDRFKIWYVGVSSPVNWGANPSGTFTTLDECPNVGNFAVSTPLTTRATFTWDVVTVLIALFVSS